MLNDALCFVMIGSKVFSAPRSLLSRKLEPFLLLYCLQLYLFSWNVVSCSLPRSVESFIMSMLSSSIYDFFLTHLTVLHEFS